MMIDSLQQQQVKVMQLIVDVCSFLKQVATDIQALVTGRFHTRVVKV